MEAASVFDCDTWLQSWKAQKMRSTDTASDMFRRTISHVGDYWGITGSGRLAIKSNDFLDIPYNKTPTSDWSTSRTTMQASAHSKTRLNKGKRWDSEDQKYPQREDSEETNDSKWATGKSSDDSSDSKAGRNVRADRRRRRRRRRRITATDSGDSEDESCRLQSKQGNTGISRNYDSSDEFTVLSPKASKIKATTSKKRRANDVSYSSTGSSRSTVKGVRRRNRRRLISSSDDGGYAKPMSIKSTSHRRIRRRRYSSSSSISEVASLSGHSKERRELLISPENVSLYYHQQYTEHVSLFFILY